MVHGAHTRDICRIYEQCKWATISEVFYFVQSSDGRGRFDFARTSNRFCFISCNFVSGTNFVHSRRMSVRSRFDPIEKLERQSATRARRDEQWRDDESDKDDVVVVTWLLLISLDLFYFAFIISVERTICKLLIAIAHSNTCNSDSAGHFLWSHAIECWGARETEITWKQWSYNYSLVQSFLCVQSMQSTVKYCNFIKKMEMHLGWTVLRRVQRCLSIRTLKLATLFIYLFSSRKWEEKKM